MTKYSTDVHQRQHRHRHQGQQEQEQEQQQQQPTDYDASNERARVYSTGSRRSLVEIVRRFGRQTSMHGVPNAIRAHSLPGRVFWQRCTATSVSVRLSVRPSVRPSGRVFWCVVCVVAASTFAFQLTQLLRKYFSYPRKVVIEVLPLAAPFPSISLCNMRNLDTIVLNRLNRIFLQTNDIGATLHRYAGETDASSPSPPLGGDVDDGVDRSAASARDNDTLPPLYRRRRRSWANKDATAATSRNDDWVRLMRNVLWKNRRTRHAGDEQPGLRARRARASSPSSTTISSGFKFDTAGNSCTLFYTQTAYVYGRKVVTNTSGDECLDVADYRTLLLLLLLLLLIFSDFDLDTISYSFAMYWMACGSK